MVPAGPHAGAVAADWIAQWAAARRFGCDAEFAMRLCVEELVTNAVIHGLKNAPGDHTIELSATSKAGEAWIEMIDVGAAFDIVQAEDPGREGTPEEATIGGRGIRLIRRFTDRLEWRRLGDRNHTTMIFKT